jgi:hypothetical protein
MNKILFNMHSTHVRAQPSELHCLIPSRGLGFVNMISVKGGKRQISFEKYNSTHIMSISAFHSLSLNAKVSLSISSSFMAIILDFIAPFSSSGLDYSNHCPVSREFTMQRQFFSVNSFVKAHSAAYTGLYSLKGFVRAPRL